MAMEANGKNRHAATPAAVTPYSQAEIDLSSPSFDAARYLAATHAVRSASDTDSGIILGFTYAWFTALTELRRATSDKTEQLKALVSAHFDQYLSCHEAVRALATDVSAHHRDTEALVGDMQSMRRVADASLAVMLQRAREQRRIRHTLAVLARLRPILELTARMKASLRLKDYDALAADYARVKHQSSKTGNLAVPLKRVVAAAHEIAATANAELLQRLEDMSASVTDQKRAIDVLTALGLVEKPILTCLTKQFEYLERKLAELDTQGQGSSDSAVQEVMKECVAIVGRFRSGLWGFICELFKTPAGSSAATSNAITSVEAERVQHQAWTIMSSCVALLQRHASPPSASRLKLLNEAFRQLRCLNKCPNAATLNANIVQLNETFCETFRTTITLTYLEQVCTSARTQLIAEYFEPVVTGLPSFSSELSVRNPSVPAISPAPVLLSPDSRTKAGRVIAEARQAFDSIWNASMISSESKVHLHRPLVFTSCATDVLQRWKAIWMDVGHVLLDVLDIGGAPNNGTGGRRSSSNNVASKSVGDDFQLRQQLVLALESHLRDMLSEFLDKLLAAFVVEIALQVPGSASGPDATRDTHSGARVCVLLAIVANCVELRENCLRKVDGWMTQLKSGDIDEDAYSNTLDHGGRAGSSSTRALCDLVQSMETKCMDIYSATHSEPLQRILRAGAAEEPLQPHSNSGSRHSSRTSRSSSVSPSSPMSLQSPSGLATPVPTPTDPRQYVFNVLLQLITLRSEVETSVGGFPQCWDYVRSVTDPLTAALAEFLQNSVRDLDRAVGTSPLEEWTRSHLLVEARFFLLALRDLMAESTKTQFTAAEKQLKDGGGEASTAAAAHVTLLNQMKHQTKLYLLALQQ
ncbi:hypothetical protein BBJ28_00004487 [Nothophytophthora sp. Chile5]|nr:hypothetical protein BBJ28_00004487 [Nothophytophthora sp. Chile5]